MMRVNNTVPNVKFKCRTLGEWVEKDTNDFFKGKRVILFSLPGAFTPTCSEHQLPDYEKNYNNFLNKGIDLDKLIKKSKVSANTVSKYNVMDAKIPTGTLNKLEKVLGKGSLSSASK